jgi:aquaporin Z
VGLAAGGRLPTGQIVACVVAQVAGAIVTAALLYIMASGAPGSDAGKGFAANGYGAHSPGQYFSQDLQPIFHPSRAWHRIAVP